MLSFNAYSSQAKTDEPLIKYPEHGFVSRLAASKWEGEPKGVRYIFSVFLAVSMSIPNSFSKQF
jgi:hypothetical protein